MSQVCVTEFLDTSVAISELQFRLKSESCHIYKHIASRTHEFTSQVYVTEFFGHIRCDLRVALSA